MRPEKQLLLDEIKGQIAVSNDLILMKYQGLGPNMASDFRNAVRDIGGSFSVVKKSIFLKAASENSIEIDKKLLKGHIGVVYLGQDIVGATKTVYQFKRDNKDIFEVLAGRFEGKICSPQDVEQISKLPSKPEMQAQLLGVFAAPQQSIVSVCESLLQEVLSCLEQRCEKQAS